MRTWITVMIALLMIGQISKASKLELMKRGHTMQYPSEGVVALSLLIDMGLMVWGLFLIIN